MYSNHSKKYTCSFYFLEVTVSQHIPGVFRLPQAVASSKILQFLLIRNLVLPQINIYYLPSILGWLGWITWGEKTSNLKSFGSTDTCFHTFGIDLKWTSKAASRTVGHIALSTKRPWSAFHQVDLIFWFEIKLVSPIHRLIYLLSIEFDKARWSRSSDQ